VPQADAVGVLLGHPYPGVVREDAQLVETNLARRRGSGLDALNHSDAMIRVDDLLTNLELHADLSFYGFGWAGGLGSVGASRIAK
jgi:hypothetical protein